MVKNFVKVWHDRITPSVVAFVLVLSSVAASVPLFLSQTAEAAGTAIINNEADLVTAAADTAVTVFSIKSSFATTQKIVLSGRNVYIDGNGNTLTFSGDTAGWQGNYVIQAYKNSVTAKNWTISGGDAAFYANGATLKLEGTINVSHNEFGGIEVSQGSGVTTPAALNAAGANVINTTEANAKPTAWIDRASVVNATVNGNFTETTHIGANQKQYYLNAVNAGIVATNVTAATTYAGVQAAVDAASAGDTIRVDQNVTLPTRSIRVTKPLTIDGNNKVVTADFLRGEAGVSNAAIVVLASNTTIKDLTVKGIGGSLATHGVVVFESQNVALNNITATNNAGGVIVNASTVTIDGITTSGNNWYGVDVDKAGAILTIKGSNSHSESVHLFVDNRTVGQIIDVNHKYSKTAAGVADIYVLDTTAPTVNWQKQPEALYTTGQGFNVRPITSEVGTTKSIYVDSVAPENLVRTLTSDHKNFDTNNSHNQALWDSLTDGTHKFIAVFSDPAGNTTTKESSSFVVDRNGPAAPQITSPVADEEFDASIRSITATWTVPTDVSGVLGYQIEYEYTRNGVRVTDTRLTTNPSRAQSLSGSVLSDFIIRVRAQDTLGQWGAWSEPVTYYYGVPAPVAPVDPEEPTDPEEEEEVVITPPPSNPLQNTPLVTILTGGATANVVAAQPQTLSAQTADSTTSVSAVAAAETEAVDGEVAENEKEIIDKASSAFQWWWLIVVAAAGLFFIIAWRRRKADEK